MLLRHESRDAVECARLCHFRISVQHFRGLNAPALYHAVVSLFDIVESRPRCHLPSITLPPPHITAPSSSSHPYPRAHAITSSKIQHLHRLPRRLRMPATVPQDPNPTRDAHHHEDAAGDAPGKDCIHRSFSLLWGSCTCVWRLLLVLLVW